MFFISGSTVVAYLHRIFKPPLRDTAKFASVWVLEVAKQGTLFLKRSYMYCYQLEYHSLNLQNEMNGVLKVFAAIVLVIYCYLTSYCYTILLVALHLGTLFSQHKIITLQKVSS